MKAARILLLNLALLATTIAVAGPDSACTRFEQAYFELQEMLEGNRTMNFERAIYVSEAAYLDDTVGYDDFRSTLDAYQYYIGQLAQANDGSDTMDFRVLVPRTGRLDIRTLKHTEGEKRALYRNVLHNWAIFAFLTDTTRFWGFEHLPLGYQYADPFGMQDWRHSQVTNLLFRQERKGNCFALVALYKILADRLHSEAYICTAPQHIYIQHQDHKGDWYNVEMATGTHPGDGSIKTLTYTWNEGITSGIAMRRLKEEKQNIALCLVNLGMSHQHKFAKQGDAFALQCADLALKHDPKNLNAMLLRQQVLEERAAVYAAEKNLTKFEQLRKTPAFSQLEEQVVQLNALGYHPMPRYMQEIILAELGQSDRGPLITKNRTPDPFPSLKNTAPGDKRYSTLSLGRFEEVHVQKRFEAYGRATLDTKEGQITEFSAETPDIPLIDPVAFAWSIDPLAMKNPYYSPYMGMNDNPVLYADPDGRSGEVTINKESKTVTVMAVYAFYGSQSSPQLAKAYAAQIQNSFNEAHGQVKIDNVEYKVQFVVVGVDLSQFGEAAVKHVIKNNTSPMSNFVRLEPNGGYGNGASFTDGVGANTGAWSTNQVETNITTPAHEFNHGMNGADHPEDVDWSGGDNSMDASIDMTIFSYRYAKPEYLRKDENGNYEVDVTKRKVTQGNIDAIFNNGIKKQLSETGRATIGDKKPINEYHK